jgi:hypothetical protein
MLRTNIAGMQQDVRHQYQIAADSSHEGHPVLVQHLPSDRPGRPRIWIDPDFLRWAYSQRSTASISQFLGVSRTTVRNALLEHGIVQPQDNPFARRRDSMANAVPGPLALLDPNLPENPFTDPLLVSYTSPVSNLSDEELDQHIFQIRRHFRQAGQSMLHGMLRNLGHQVPIQRIRDSLVRLDPVRRVFERIRIRRRVYHVLGPNSLWHHDGQHGNSVYFCV